MTGGETYQAIIDAILAINDLAAFESRQNDDVLTYAADAIEENDSLQERTFVVLIVNTPVRTGRHGHCKERTARFAVLRYYANDLASTKRMLDDEVLVDNALRTLTQVTDIVEVRERTGGTVRVFSGGQAVRTPFTVVFRNTEA